MVNFKGKYKYVGNLIKNYSDWYNILLGRLTQKRLPFVNLRNGITVKGGPKSEVVDIVDEIFFKKVYNPDYLKINKGDTVIDIGANIGVYSLFAASMGAGKIISVEPLPENVKLIKENFKKNKFTPPITHQAAVSGRNGKRKLYIGDIDSHNLLFDHNYKNEKYSKYINVPSLTLAKVLEINKISKVDFLKIDCEGSEGEIFTSTTPSVWKGIEKIAIEYHDGVSSLNHNEIRTKLKKYGYNVKIVKSDDNFGYIYAY